MIYDAQVYGPPGTGKTTSSVGWITRQIERGCDPYRSAFVSFTNVACDEAKEKLVERLGIPPDDLPYCRTIHSSALRALGIQGSEWNQSTRMKKFGEEYGYDLEPAKKPTQGEDLEEQQAATGEDGPLLAIWDYGRNRLIRDPAAAFRAWSEQDPEFAAMLDFRRYLRLVADWEKDKQENGRLDFTDLLMGVVDSPHDLSVPVSAVVIDEAQDLSPAQWVVAEKLFGSAERSACAGDDDQSIMDFQGVDPALFNGREAKRRVLLDRSYRLPRRVCELALKVIGRNRNRIAKNISPKDSEGEVRAISDLRQCDLANGETWMVLVRNWSFAAEIISILEQQGLPYRVPAGRYYSPWDDKGPYRAARLVLALAAGQEIPLVDLVELAERTSSETGEKPGAWKYGAKAKLTRLAEADPLGTVSLRELPKLDLTPLGLAQILNQDLSILAKISQRDRDAYSAAMKAGRFGETPRIRVSSIHGMKGAEAENVVALEACSNATYRATLDPSRAETERRLGYVAITRASQRFFSLQGFRGKPYPAYGFGGF